MSGEGRSLLLVDDDETTRELLTLLLEAEGWAVTTAVDGEAAVACVRTMATAPAVVLTDMQMPGLTGGPLGEALLDAAAARGAESPVLLAMTATVTAPMPDGFTALLVKPFPASSVALCCRSRSQTPPSKLIANARAEVVPAIDPATLERLRATMPADRLMALYEFALSDAESRARKMDAAAAAGDDAAFRREAHAAKGSCGMIGAVGLGKLAAVAEREGVTTQPLTGWNLLADFLGEIARIRHILEEFRPA